MNKSKDNPKGEVKGGAMVGRCAGFSSAFVLRHSGVQIGGEEAFKKVPFQMKGGLAFPKGITGFFKKLWNTSMLKMPLYRNMFYVMK